MNNPPAHTRSAPLRPRKTMTCMAAFALAVSALGAAMSALAAPARPSADAVMRTVEVTLPAGATTFPPGPGSDLANAHCAICHSVGMVLRQPPLSFDEWKAEVTKMRVAYGAPLPAEDVEKVAHYLTAVNGKR